MVRHCIIFHGMLTSRREFRIADAAKEVGVSYITAYRWIRSFARVLDLRVERGVVIVG